MGKTIFLECAAGISGDMTVGALLDLGADEAYLRAQLSSLQLDGYSIEVKDVMKAGIRAKQFRVILAQDGPVDGGCEGHHHSGHDHSEHTHHHSEHHHSEHTHRNYAAVRNILASGNLTAGERETSERIFLWIAEAEAHAHRKPQDEVFFHEVGAVDSIIDVAATAVCLHNLGVDEVIVTALTEGTGYVDCHHGRLPVPVPAVLYICEKAKLPLRFLEGAGELVTPTGAAIAAAVRTRDALPETARVLRTGHGAGCKNFSFPNILRILLLDA
jgi:uncharacterized protein (TIGR00299 family) protein